ncbi:MAG: gliding motility-associated C-terminal domain-containing protein [Taibaiella sp.]|jgi:hypothetical protein
MKKFTPYYLIPICLLLSCFNIAQAQLSSYSGSNNLNGVTGQSTAFAIVNDVLHYAANSSCASMHIFNRWKQMIYSAYKDNHPWDRMHKGRTADAGTYYHTIEGVCSATGQQMQTKGESTLIR